VISLALAVAAIALSLWAWFRDGPGWALPALSSGCAALAVAFAAVATQFANAYICFVGAVLATIGGGPITQAVFQLIDSAGEHTRQAGEVLRGGAWLGCLERAAVFATLVAGWPEGIALTLALKGLGRYPELRAGATTGVAERFLIGTFVSLLWAGLCALFASLMLGSQLS
jgi:hypothetical protein